MVCVIQSYLQVVKKDFKVKKGVWTNLIFFWHGSASISSSSESFSIGSIEFCLFVMWNKQLWGVTLCSWCAGKHTLRETSKGPDEWQFFYLQDRQCFSVTCAFLDGNQISEHYTRIPSDTGVWVERFLLSPLYIIQVTCRWSSLAKYLWCTLATSCKKSLEWYI